MRPRISCVSSDEITGPLVCFRAVVQRVPNNCATSRSGQPRRGRLRLRIDGLFSPRTDPHRRGQPVSPRLRRTLTRQAPDWLQPIQAPRTVRSVAITMGILCRLRGDAPRYDILKQTGETSLIAGAEGATAPETLRQKDRHTSTSGEKRTARFVRRRNNVLRHKRQMGRKVLACPPPSPRPRLSDATSALRPPTSKKCSRL